MLDRYREVPGKFVPDGEPRQSNSRRWPCSYSSSGQFVILPKLDPRPANIEVRDGYDVLVVAVAVMCAIQFGAVASALGWAIAIGRLAPNGHRRLFVPEPAAPVHPVDSAGAAGTERWFYVVTCGVARWCDGIVYSNACALTNRAPLSRF